MRLAVLKKQGAVTDHLYALMPEDTVPQSHIGSALMRVETGEFASFQLHIPAEIRRKGSPICLVINIVGLAAILP